LIFFKSWTKNWLACNSTNQKKNKVVSSNRYNSKKYKNHVFCWGNRIICISTTFISQNKTHGIHRLKRTWSCVDNSVNQIFSHVQMYSKKANNEANSIPYLGHFLTDLMMIDAAYSGLNLKIIVKIFHSLALCVQGPQKTITLLFYLKIW
jgi:hypothetical protein